MRLMISSLFVLMLASCTSDKTTPNDAATKTDATSTDAASIDAASAVCTGQIYDACNPASSNCVTGTTCHNYAASNFSACVPTCSMPPHAPTRAQPPLHATRWASASRTRPTPATPP